MTLEPEQLDEDFEASNGVIPSNIVIRKFEPKDTPGVKKICFQHFRSTCVAAVTYYAASHIDDLCVWGVILLILANLKRMIIGLVLFILFLFCKSMYEVEYYIKRHCQDLDEIELFYCNNGNKRGFWIAEVVIEDVPTVVGCIGLLAHDNSCGKVVRFTVHENYRKCGAGSMLLQHLEKCAIEANYDALFLYTNTLNPTHAKFVISHYFNLLGTVPRGLMRGDLLIWQKNVQNKNDQGIVPLDSWKPTKHYL